jgi:hypothetical protein
MKITAVAVVGRTSNGIGNIKLGTNDIMYRH